MVAGPARRAPVWDLPEPDSPITPSASGLNREVSPLYRHKLAPAEPALEASQSRGIDDAQALALNDRHRISRRFNDIAHGAAFDELLRIGCCGRENTDCTLRLQDGHAPSRQPGWQAGAPCSGHG